MTKESYTTFAEKVQTEMQNLDYEEQLGILTIVVSAMNQKEKSSPKMSKKTYPKMSKEETMRLFNELTGCIKNVKNIDAKKEYLEYLDERYGV